MLFYVLVLSYLQEAQCKQAYMHQEFHHHCLSFKKSRFSSFDLGIIVGTAPQVGQVTCVDAICCVLHTTQCHGFNSETCSLPWSNISSMDHAQRHVTGSADIVLHKGNVLNVGRSSPLSLYVPLFFFFCWCFSERDFVLCAVLVGADFFFFFFFFFFFPFLFASFFVFSFFFFDPDTTWI